MKNVWIQFRRIAIILAAALVVVGLTIVIGNQFMGEMPTPPDREAMVVSESGTDEALTIETDEFSVADSDATFEGESTEGRPEMGDDHGHGQASLQTVALGVAQNGAKVLGIVLVLALAEWLIANRKSIVTRLTRRKPSAVHG